jgi:hypothetical protein
VLPDQQRARPPWCGCPEHNLGGLQPPATPARRFTYGTGRPSPVLPTEGVVHRIEYVGTDGQWEIEIPTLELSAKKQAALAAAKAGGTGYRRRTTVPLRRQVAQLREHGLVPSAIADALNLSDRRVKTILRELKAAA